MSNSEVDDRRGGAGAIRFDWFQTGFPDQTLGPVPLAPHATDPALGSRLWTISEELTGVRFPLLDRDRG